MAKVRIEWKPNALYDVRRSPEIQNALEDEAWAVAQRAGGETEGYITGSRQGERRPQGRWRASVVTGDSNAIRDNAANNTLIRALGAGGG